MKWLELHLDTQPAGIEPATELLSEYGIDSLMIDEEGDFKDFLENNHQYWDYVDDELMEQMHGKARMLHPICLCSLGLPMSDKPSRTHPYLYLLSKPYGQPLPKSLQQNGTTSGGLPSPNRNIQSL